MSLENYLVKKEKTDLLSSLKALNKKILMKKLDRYVADNIKELKENILDEFEFCLKMANDDVFTKIYFENLLSHENSKVIAAYEQDIDACFVFIYKKDNHYSYYIPDEIKRIIKKELNL